MEDDDQREMGGNITRRGCQFLLGQPRGIMDFA